MPIDRTPHARCPDLSLDLDAVTDRANARGTPPAARSKFLWSVAPPVLRGIGRTLFDLRVVRESDLPSPPFVVAANHYSHFDPPAIAAAMDIRVKYLALEDLFTANRLLNWLFTGFDAIPTPRGRQPLKAVRTALAALEAGDVVGVFPEATRVSHWGVVPPKRGAAWLALRSSVPLVPVAVVGTGRVFGLDNQLRRAPIRVVLGEPMGPDGFDVEDLTTSWSRWMDDRISRYPGSEVSGPPRTQLDSI
jgi:1-acyl-sn-glycerol-3-phosphate acyltransferase